MWFVLILKCFIVEGYQEQIAQGAQQSQQDQNYIPQAGSQGSNTPKTSFLPRGNSRVFGTAKPAHLTAHNSNQDYRWEVAGCHKLPIVAKEGFRQFIVSPSFPNINPSPTTCIWRIKADQGMLVRINFREFHIDNCKKASIRLFNGFEPEVDPTPRTHCGLQKPEVFISSGRLMTMVLSAPATESPFGVKLMIGFEAIPDVKYGAPNYFDYSQNGFASFPGSVPIPISAPGQEVISVSGNVALVKTGKYSYEEIKISETISEILSDEDFMAEEDTLKSDNSAEKSLLKPLIGASFALLLVLLVVYKVTCSKKDQETKNETT